ncbi:BOI-related E3 ubiquitin-protein ligase 1-like [Macadamia integrifolia]|uniref:BOI-related E3 ubiquitin-protein ligase 1-like n=1 Tax=Macadamia integrifolia TaxID=60698 RepID=UPI001C4FD9DD|nr:BOI-related E3 ubiquitin-protein ligase 1-like [Macadamia integrifolia]
MYIYDAAPSPSENRILYHRESDRQTDRVIDASPLVITSSISHGHASTASIPTAAATSTSTPLIVTLQGSESEDEQNSFSNLLPVDGQMSTPVAFFNPRNFADQSHPQYIPPFHVVGFAPGAVPAMDCGGSDMRWNNGSEPTKKKLKEQDFLENNSQITSVDFLQTRSVSTGLGLSLDDRRMASSADSPVFSLFDNEIDQELQRQDVELDRFIKLQGERMRQAILEKVQANQLQTLSFAEERILQKLRDKEAEVEDINRKNMELEERMKQLSIEAGAWQQRAKSNDNIITSLKFNLQQVFAQSRDSKEGCGDSEVDDAASCCNGVAIDFNPVSKESKDLKELMTCKVCRVNVACMLLLPCRHLCMCNDCESKLNFCPLCHYSKLIGMEVYM